VDSSRVAHGFFIDKGPWALKDVHGFFGAVRAYPTALAMVKHSERRMPYWRKGLSKRWVEFMMHC